MLHEGMPSLKLAPDTKVVVLTGAGISAESGIATFRDADGLWEQHRLAHRPPVAHLADQAGGRVHHARAADAQEHRRALDAALDLLHRERQLAEPHDVRPLQRAAVFLCVGSSGVVYPAAGLVGELAYRRSMGEVVRSIYVGLERPANAAQFDQIVLGKAGEVLPGLLAA